jgi:hypothetical protein
MGDRQILPIQQNSILIALIFLPKTVGFPVSPMSFPHARRQSRRRMAQKPKIPQPPVERYAVSGENRRKVISGKIGLALPLFATKIPLPDLQVCGLRGIFP